MPDGTFEVVHSGQHRFNVLGDGSPPPEGYTRYQAVCFVEGNSRRSHLDELKSKISPPTMS